MPIRDFGLLFLVCMVWGLNVIVTRWVFLNSDVQPVFYAALRFGLIALVLLPILFRRVPKNLGKLFLIATCM
ncbi:MAG TPA: EamA/RhaT family transporter, partial [Hyphomonadaceae bacterium]|nr:EamA/RhaT family transporter [Hyphomonadaceae bacterium]